MYLYNVFVYLTYLILYVWLSEMQTHSPAHKKQVQNTQDETFIYLSHAESE